MLNPDPVVVEGTHVKVSSKFFENKDPVVQATYNQALARRIERIVRAWMMDTGIWAVTAQVEVVPSDLRGHLRVDAHVETDVKPLRNEAGGV